jgi:hypothetical protein
VNAHAVLKLAESALELRRMKPSAIPATTRFALLGAIPTALTERSPGVELLALVQLVAPFVVRQRLQPPVHSCWLFDGFISNGATNWKPSSVIPLVASNQVAPPLNDFWIERFEFSA